VSNLAVQSVEAFAIPSPTPRPSRRRRPNRRRRQATPTPTQPDPDRAADGFSDAHAGQPRAETLPTSTAFKLRGLTVTARKIYVRMRARRACSSSQPA